MFILSGCNGSGKTTASYSLLPDLIGCSELVKSDEFAKSLSPFNPSAASVMASRYMLMKIKYMLSRKADFIIETTLATRSLMNTINEAKSLGYEVTLLYFWLNSVDLARKRVKKRVESGGHHIHEEVIRKIIDYADSIGFEVLHLEYSPIKGPEGNIEYLLHIRKPEEIAEEKLALTEQEAESALQTIVEEKTGLSYTPEWDAVIKGIVDNSHTL